ncbi:acyltransferase [Rhizobium sp. AC44/96]|uniref:acyltransferase family protein n=1 Tax=Rhizobium sp. AC44/96 TaxID=1841654 RepID=UPI0009F26E97|nr:acyltransferase [Rhizobium sp. AC44/96]
MANEGRMGRRHDVDFLRVCAFGLLIVYHSSILYSSRGWLHQAGGESWFFDLISIGSHPWRMSLLFFLSGVVTAALTSRRSPGEVRLFRSRQLLPPLLIGMLVIIPPQIYITLKMQSGFSMPYLQFWWSYVTGGFIDASGREVGSFAHLWFLAYLWVYTALWALLHHYAPALFLRGGAWLSKTLHGVGLLYWPVLYLAILRLALFPAFGETLNPVTDWYAHIVYFSFFLAGALLARHGDFWDAVVARRKMALMIALACVVVLAVIVTTIPTAERPALLVTALRVCRSAFQWTAIVALLGYARRFVRHSNPVVMYLNRAVLTYYVLHQTVLVLVAYWLQQHGMQPPWAFGVVVIVTCAVCAIAYELQRRLLSVASFLGRKQPQLGVS